MRFNYKSKLNNEGGFSITILTIFIIIFILYSAVHEQRFTETIQVYDTGLQRGVAEAVRSATMMANEDSLALGKPTINADLAHETFSRIINGRVHYGEIEKYTLVVYNHGYGNEGKAHFYIKDGGTITEETITFIGDTGQTFYITTEDIKLTNGEASVSFEVPGCIALIELRAEGNSGETQTGLRWASAEMVISKDFY